MLRQILLAAALTSAGIATAQASHFDVCDVESDYSLRLTPETLVFERDSGTPRQVVMAHGRLIVDGTPIELIAADRERIAHFEATLRELIPEAKSIALEAVDVAFDAVSAVSEIFQRDAERIERTAEKLAETRITIEREVERSFDEHAFNEARVEEVVEQAVASLVPTLVGDITATALTIAFSGDEDAARELEHRAERLEERIEREVEKRARQLEQRAEALCPIVADLDRIESELSLRLAADGRLDLVRRD